MIGIFVMFSPDRLPQLAQAVECMREMSLYDRCQKTLLVDDSDVTHPSLPEWEHVKVSRPRKEFNWSRMWEVGVGHSRHEVVLYLDSDRVLPRDYLEAVLANARDGAFLFCRNLFSFRRAVGIHVVKNYRDGHTPESLKADYDRHKDLLWYDPRFGLPCDGPGKGVMSGNTAFTRETFKRSGGVDPFYRGHGAWADSDFHRQCWGMGMGMVDLGRLELHLHHDKLAAGGGELAAHDVEVLSLNNYVRYCSKWNVDLDRARDVASLLKLPDGFVERVKESLHRQATPSDEDHLWQPLLR